MKLCKIESRKAEVLAPAFPESISNQASMDPLGESLSKSPQTVNMAEIKDMRLCEGIYLFSFLSFVCSLP